MAPINVYGTAVVRVALPGSRGTWWELGKTRNGVDITEVTKTLDMPTDHFGGQDGAPSEIAFLSRIDRVKVELTKYSLAVAEGLRVSLSDGTPEDQFGAGNLYFSRRITFGLWLDYDRAALADAGLIVDRVYQDAVIRDAIEINKGTKFSRYIATFDCYVRAFSSTSVSSSDLGATPDDPAESANSPPEGYV